MAGTVHLVDDAQDAVALVTGTDRPVRSGART